MDDNIRSINRTKPKKGWNWTQQGKISQTMLNHKYRQQEKQHNPVYKKFNNTT